MVSGKAQRLFMQLSHDASFQIRNEPWREERKPEGFVFVNPANLPEALAELEQLGVVRRLTEEEVVRLHQDYPPSKNDQDAILEMAAECQQTFEQWKDSDDPTEKWLSGAMQRLGEAHQDMVNAIPMDLFLETASGAAVYHIMEVSKAWPLLTGHRWVFDALKDQY